jgi:hypothetical protein
MVLLYKDTNDMKLLHWVAVSKMQCGSFYCQYKQCLFHNSDTNWGWIVSRAPFCCCNNSFRTTRLSSPTNRILITHSTRSTSVYSQCCICYSSWAMHMNSLIISISRNSLKFKSYLFLYEVCLNGWLITSCKLIGRTL